MIRFIDLFQWWNAIYAVPLLVAILYMAAVHLAGALESAGDALGGHSGDAAHGGTDAADTGHTGGDAPGHHEADHGEHYVDMADPWHDGVLTWHDLAAVLGIGRAPITFIIQIFLLIWGGTGLMLNVLLSGGLDRPPVVALTLPLAFVIATLVTRTVAVTIGRFVRFETSATRRGDLIGRTGKVVYPVTAEEGTVHVRDEYGTLHRVRARTKHEPLDSGREVVMVDYDLEQNIYWVDDAIQFIHRGG
ncbi:MAG: DUF1449 family protein [Armatimonadetes bacterium]|nr:DUF1449 family protein [Armatimonadota bacterium]